MSSIVGILRRPTCVSCLRRLAGEDLIPWVRPSHLQLRGKKRSAKSPETINVKLLVDMKGYGRKGKRLPMPLTYKILSDGLLQVSLLRLHLGECATPGTPDNKRSTYRPSRTSTPKLLSQKGTLHLVWRRKKERYRPLSVRQARGRP